MGVVNIILDKGGDCGSRTSVIGKRYSDTREERRKRVDAARQRGPRFPPILHPLHTLNLARELGECNYT